MSTGTNIYRLIPNDEFLAMINANNPNAANPFATIADIAGIVPISYALNYSALPAANTVSGQYYFVEQSQGTKWLPGNLGGTYYSNGLYYSNGTDWVVTELPYEATQIEVNAGIVTFKFVTPVTLKNSTQWDTKTDIRANRYVSTNSSLLNTDRNVVFTGTLTFTLIAVASITHFEEIKLSNDNTSTGTVTINTTGGELLYDAVTFDLYPGETLSIYKGVGKYVVG